MNRHPRQTSPYDLFMAPRPAPQIAGSMDFRKIVSQQIGQMLENAAAVGIDRHEVAARASRLTGQNISKAMLDGYTAPSRSAFNVPLWIAPVLEIVCESTLLAEWHAQVVGGQLLLGADNLDVQIGRMERQRVVANKALRNLRNLSERAG